MKNIFYTFLLVLASLSAEDSFNWEGMNPSVSPAENFYQYANGTWSAKTEVPEGYPMWGTFQILRQENVQQLKALFGEGFTPQTHSERLVADFFYSFSNQQQQDEWGARPLEALLATIDAIKTKEDVFMVVAALHKKGFQTFFRYGVGADPRNSKQRILHLDQGGLNVSDYEMYLEEYDTPINKHADQRKEYLSYLVKIFSLLGASEQVAQEKAQKVFAIEKRLAAKFYTKEQSRDIELTTNILSIQELQKKAAFDYDMLFKTWTIAPNEVNVGNIEFLKSSFVTMQEMDVEDIKAYLTLSVVNAVVDTLGKPFYDAQFAFYSRTLSGVNVSRPIEERAINSINTYLGDALGRLYVAKYFSPGKKKEVEEMVARVRKAFGRSIRDLNWMEEATKDRAIVKVEKMAVQVGYPDEEHWTDYTSLTAVSQEQPLATNLLAILSFHAQHELSKLEKEVDRNDWPWSPQVVNACNCPDENKINFPAGILQKPLIAEDPAVSWGAFGMIICHEIIHSFDDQGRKYNAEGCQEDWWHEEDLARFTRHADLIRDQFNRYEIKFSDGSCHTVRGGLCLGENIADLGGLLIAYAAFEDYLKEHPLPVVNGFTPEQRFFLGYAQVWRSKSTEETAKLLLNNDPHSPPVWRVNGPLSHMPQFRKAFHVPEGAPMAVPELERSKMWLN